jgi:hypothetical protein
MIENPILQFTLQGMQLFTAQLGEGISKCGSDYYYPHPNVRKGFPSTVGNTMNLT